MYTSLLLCNYNYFNMQTASAKCKFKNSLKTKCLLLKEFETVHVARKLVNIKVKKDQRLPYKRAS